MANAKKTLKKLPYPQLENPRLFQDGITWLRVFHRRADLVEAPFYGVNIWRVKRKNLAISIARLITLASPGLNNSYGKVHYLEFFEPKDQSDLLTVVLIYDWYSLPKVIDDTPPLSVLPAHFRFISIIEAYNWNLVKELETDPAVYASMITHRFHNDICTD